MNLNEDPNEIQVKTRMSWVEEYLIYMGKSIKEIMHGLALKERTLVGNKEIPLDNIKSTFDITDRLEPFNGKDISMSTLIVGA